jgi:hypothetical protein
LFNVPRFVHGGDGNSSRWPSFSMQPNVQRLIEIVPPPTDPVDTGSGSFSDVEEVLGLKLPADYKDYITAFGSGGWHDCWWILNPFTDNEHGNLLLQSQDRRPKNWSALDAERASRDAEGRFPHPIYPEQGGILPWAITDRGGRFYWLTEGNPDSWVTIYYAGLSPAFETYDLPCISILLRIVTDQFPAFADLFSDHEHLYGEPYNFAGPGSFAPTKRKRKRSKRK